MGLLRRRRRSPGRPAADTAQGRRDLVAEWPGPGDEPLLRVEWRQEHRPEADGERVHLRLRLQTRFSSLQAVLDAPEPASVPRSSPGDQAMVPSRSGTLARSWAQRALRTSLGRRVVAPLLRYDLNTLIDVQASTASLAAGSRALMPAPERLATLGIQPDLSPQAPPLQTWAAERPQGLLQVSLLRIDREQLSARLQQALGSAPFALTAAIIQTLDRK